MVRPPGGFHHQGGQSQQSQGVGKDHELIKQVGQGPHQVIGQTRAQEDEHHPKHRVDGSGSLAEEIGHVELAKKFQLRMVENAKKRRHTATKILPSPSPKTLEKASCAMLDWSMPSAAPPAKGAVAGIQGGDDHQRGHGKNQEGVDEYPDHGDHTLLMRGFDLGHGVGMGGGAHTRPRWKTAPA